MMNDLDYNHRNPTVGTKFWVQPADSGSGVLDIMTLSCGVCGMYCWLHVDVTSFIIDSFPTFLCHLKRKNRIGNWA